MQWIITPEDEGARLDQWLTRALADPSRTTVQRWIADGLAAVDGAPARPALRLEVGMVVTLGDVPATPPAPAEPQAQVIPLRIVYEDESILVVDKPAGMVVHPAPGHAQGTLVNAVLAYDPTIGGVGGPGRPGIVHRLDKETSGLIVVARTNRAHRDLQEQFKARTVYKEYLALVEGRPDPAEGIIDAPLGRHPVDGRRQAILPVDARTGETAGREAITEYHTLENGVLLTAGGRMSFTLLRCVLRTGRTHQIRVHLAWRRHPVLGDTLYGPRTPRLAIGRHFLHAHKLRLRVPFTGETREFVAHLPTELQAILDRLRAG